MSLNFDSDNTPIPLPPTRSYQPHHFHTPLVEGQGLRTRSSTSSSTSSIQSSIPQSKLHTDRGTQGKEPSTSRWKFKPVSYVPFQKEEWIHREIKVKEVVAVPGRVKVWWGGF